MTHTTAAYAVSGLPFTVDETATTAWSPNDRFHAGELMGWYRGTRRPLGPGVMTTEFVIRWEHYFLNGTPIVSLLNDFDQHGYGLTAQVTVEQSLGPAPQPGAVRGTLALHFCQDPTDIGSPYMHDDDLLVCTSDLLREISGNPLILSVPVPGTGMGYASLRFDGVSLTPPAGERYWPDPEPFYVQVALDFDIQASSTEPGVLQGGVRLYFVNTLQVPCPPSVAGAGAAT